MDKNYKILLSFFRTPVTFETTFYDYEYDNHYINGSIRVPDNIMGVIRKIMDDKFELIFDLAGSETDYYQYVFRIDPKKKSLILFMKGETYTQSDDTTHGQITNQEFKEKCDNLDIKEIIAKYNGSGDSGWIEELYFNGNKIETNRDTTIIEDELYSLLEYKFSGWEIDEGSSGEIFVNDELYYTINHTWWARELVRTTPYYNLIEGKFEDE